VRVRFHPISIHTRGQTGLYVRGFVRRVRFEQRVEVERTAAGE
jgi:hypothetical protein